MKISKHFIACMVVIVGFGCFLLVTGLPDHTRELDVQTVRMIKLIIEVGALVVAGLTNMAYRLFSKYDRDRAMLNLPDELSAKGNSAAVGGTVPAAPVQEFSIPKPRKSHHCLCGYDLRAKPDAWMQYDSESIERCPECSRTIYREDYADFGAVEPRELEEEKERTDLVGVGPESAQDRT